MSQYWWIAKRKFKHTSEDVIKKNDVIDKERWIEIVESDPELFWFEDTKLGKEVVEFDKKNNIDFRFKSSAHFQINKKWGHGGLQIIVSQEGNFIHTVNTRTTLRRILKLKEIADKLDCKLFRNRTEMTEEKYKKILEKYRIKK